MFNWISLLLEDITAMQVAAWIALVIGLTILVRKIWRPLKRLIKLTDALSELPEFIPTQRVEMQALRQEVREIHHEVHYNNGSSVKDAVGRIETGVARMHEKFEDRLREIDERTQPNPLRKDSK